MIIDLHTHTKPWSYDSNLDLPQLIRHAKQNGLDGICVTEHDRLWDKDSLAKLSQEHDFLVLPGIEVSTEEGHLLVFGVEQYTCGLWHTENLKRVVDEVGGVIIMSHPFRQRFYSDDDINTVVEQYRQRRVFSMVDAVEVLNGRGADWQNAFSRELSYRLDLKGVGGSDAHDLTDVPSCATFFERDISSVEDLIIELKNGRFHAVNLRQS